MSIRKNTIYNVLGTGIPVLLSLVVTPLYLKSIGDARYGVMAIVWLMLGYFGLFEFGFGRAVAQQIAEQKRRATNDSGEILWTGLTCSATLGTLGGVLLWMIGEWTLGHLMAMETPLRSEAMSIVPLLVLAVPMAAISGVLQGALQGWEKFGWINLISLFGTSLFLLLPLVAADWLGPQLLWLVGAALLARLVTLLWSALICAHFLHASAGLRLSKSRAQALFRFGGWVSVSSVLNPLLVALDRFWIGSFLGVRAVAHYAVPYQITEKLTLLPSALASAAFANFAQLDFVQSIRFATRLLRKLMLWTTPLAVVGVFLIHPFLALWISPDFAGQSRHVGEILVLAFWVNGLAQVPYYLLQARGRPQVSAKCHLWELVPYVVVLYLGLKWGGLIGVALAVLARVVADFLLLASFSGVLPLLARSMLVPLLWVMVAFAVVSTVNMQDGVGSLLMIVYPLAAGAWAAWEWRKIKDKTD